MQRNAAYSGISPVCHRVVRLRWLKYPRRGVAQDRNMKITGITCSSCGAAYEMAEATSVQGSPGQENCTLCGTVLAHWHEPGLRVFRLVMASEHRYASIPAPPSPEAVGQISADIEPA